MLLWVTVHLLFFHQLVYADEPLQLICDAAEYSLKSSFTLDEEGKVPGLSKGSLYYIGATLAPFVQASSGVVLASRKCKKVDKSDTKICRIVVRERSECKDQKKVFKIRALSEDSERFVVGDRCDGGYHKFIDTSDLNNDDKEGAYVLYLSEEGSLFQAKHQIFRGTQVTTFPDLTLRVDKTSNSITLLISGYQHMAQYASDGWIKEDFPMYQLSTNCSYLP